MLLFLKTYCGLPYLLAAMPSFVAGSVVGYYLCTRFVFQDVGDAHPLGLALFILLGGVGLAINAAVLAFAVEIVHVSLLIAKAAAAICTFFANYALRKRWVFTPAYCPASRAAEKPAQ